jgi:predicted GTPase
MAVAQRRIVIMGAAGRDFHNFNVVYRDDPTVSVVAFTAAQIPRIDRRRYPPELAGGRYPEGIPIVPEDELDSLIKNERVDEVIFAYIYPEAELVSLIAKLKADQVVFAYSDVSHEYVMHQASRVLAAGADFALLGPAGTAIGCAVPVISVLATRTGAGKSPTSRFVAGMLMERGIRPAVIRHPMPYGDLVAQRVQRFAALADLDRAQATVEEREDYEPHIRRGLVVWAGVDYQAIVREAEKEAALIIWDGGNNDFSFLRSDLTIVVVDPFRPGHELAYHPGEMNLRSADVVVVSKVNTAPPENVERVLANVKSVNSSAVIVQTDTVITASDSGPIKGKRVLVIEDGPTLTHGGMGTGAGMEAAKQFGAAEVIDPRPSAQGVIAATYETYSHLGPILPAVGYYEEQLRDLEGTINAVPADVVVSATPFSLGTLLTLDKPLVQITYELAERDEPRLSEQVNAFLQAKGLGK